MSFAAGKMVVALGLTTCLSAQAASYGIGTKTPSWVRPVEGTDEPGSSERRWTDWEETLVDRQIKVSSAGTERFHHRVRKVLNTTGVAEASEIAIDYLPAFQHLDVHEVRLRRDGVWKDKLPSAGIREFATEQDRTRRIYDGTHRLEISLSDVRSGDEIEYSFTIRGDNPALAGHFGGRFWLGSMGGLDHEYFSVLWPRARPVWQRIQGSQDKLTRADEADSVRWSWRGTDLPAVTEEDSVPHWFDPLPFAEFSDFASWADVAAWALPLYTQPDTLPAELMTKISDLAKLPTETARLVAATRLVQDEVRYLGIELGKGAFAPRSPSETWTRRYGDCKDKALLLVAVLEKLGIDAAPALVDSSSGKTLDSRLPSAGAFDHVIVRAVADSTARWVDATMTHLKGDIEAFSAPDYGYALVIAADTSALTKMPSVELNEPNAEIVETFSILPDSSVRLQVSTRYRHDDAASVRERLQTESKKEIGRDYLNYYARDYPEIEQAHELEAEHHPNGEVTVSEEYRIPNFFVDGKRTLSAWLVADALKRPRIVKRQMPLALPYPEFVRHTLNIEWELDTSFETDTEKLESPHLSFLRRGSSAAGRATLVYELRTRSDHVAPDAVAAHLATMSKILDVTDYVLESESSTAVPEASSGPWIGVGIVLVGGLVVFGVWRGRRRRSWKRKSEELPGETAATAIPIGRTDEIDERAGALRCGDCRGPLRRTASHARSIRFDGREITSVEVACTQCGHSTSRYFAVQK